MQRVVGLAEAFDIARGRSSDQTSVQRVGPGMIGALDGFGEAAAVLLAETSTTVSAHVIVRSNRAATIAKEDDAFGSDLLQEILAWLADPIFPAHAEPPLGKDPLELHRKNVAGDVVAT